MATINSACRIHLNSRYTFSYLFFLADLKEYFDIYNIITAKIAKKIQLLKRKISSAKFSNHLEVTNRKDFFLKKFILTDNTATSKMMINFSSSL